MGKTREITIESFDYAVQRALEEIGKDVETDMEDVKERLSRMTVKRLKMTSPKKRGDYANGWSVKKTKTGYIVYNKYGQLTHLLEKGHPLVDSDGNVYGRAKAIPHIADAEAWMWKMAETVLYNRLNGNGG